MSLFGNNAASGAGTAFGAPLQRSSTLPLSTGATPKLSLFGNTTTPSTQASTPPAGGIFGQPAAQTTQPTGGLFGQINNQPATSTGSLFGSTNTQQQPQQPQGLSAPTIANPASTTTSAFGQTLGQNTQNASSQGVAGNSLFASLRPPQNNNASLSQSQATASSSSYFDQMLERGRKRDFAANGGNSDLPSLQLGLSDIARKARNLGNGGPSAAEAHIGSAAAAHATDAKGHYLLSSAGVSTVNALRDLSSFSANTGGAVRSNDPIKIETDLDEFMTNLRTRSTLEMIQDGLEQSKRDFDNFLEETVQMNWDAQRLKIYEHFGLGRPAERLSGSAMNGQSTRGAFGKSSRGKGQGASASMSFGASRLQKSVLGNSTARTSTKRSTSDDTISGPRIHLEDRGSRERQDLYAKRVQEFNEARSTGSCYPLLHQMCTIEDFAGDRNKGSVSDSYKAVIEVVEEQGQVLQRSSPAVRSWERKFAPAYLDDNPNSQQSVDLRKRILKGAQTCLEKIFWRRVESTVEKNPKDAALGGVPSQINKVRGFVRVLAKQKNLVVAENQDVEMESLQKLTIGNETDYCWALIYYLLRCGLVNEAAQYVADNSRAIRSLDRNFSRYIEAYSSNTNRRLPNDLRQAIQAEYRGKSRVHDAAQTDPYKIASYKIIGRCELGRKSLDRVPGDQEDWIWLQFVLAREVNRAEEAAGDAFGLEQLQTIVKDIGQRHFSSGSDNASGYGIYFFLQVLAGLYEPAVKWLYDHDYVAAVHFSIALAYYGLLRVADLSSNNILSYTAREQPRLQFALMVGYYTAEFRAAKPDVATDYLILLSLNADLVGEAGRQQAQICLDALRELVLETREFAQLLGDIQSDGQRLPGAIQVRQELVRKSAEAIQEISIEQFVQTLTIQAARAADEAGRTTDSVLLYHLAGEYDNVLTIVNRTLSEALTVPLGQQAMRLEPLKPRKADASDVRSGSLTLSLTSIDDPVILANNILQLYLGPNRQTAISKIATSTREATELLLRMAQAKEQLLSKQFNKCIDIIGNTQILPLDAGGDVSKVRQCAQNFNSLVPVVARCIGDMIIWTVWACSKEKERLTREGWETDGRRQAVRAHNTAIADLNIFAGLIRYKLRQDVFEVLAQAAENTI